METEGKLDELDDLLFTIWLTTKTRDAMNFLSIMQKIPPMIRDAEQRVHLSEGADEPVCTCIAANVLHEKTYPVAKSPIGRWRSGR